MPKVDISGNPVYSGTDEPSYVELDSTTSVPAGYKLASYDCGNEDETTTITYNPGTNLFTVSAEEEVSCSVYMDVNDVDIGLTIYIYDSSSSSYVKTTSIPSDTYYVLNTDLIDGVARSHCTGNNNTISFANQSISIASTTQTVCEAYLDSSTGPLLDAVAIEIDGSDVTLTVTPNDNSTTITNYYFSSDDGVTYDSNALDASNNYYELSSNKSNIITKTITIPYTEVNEYSYRARTQTMNVAVTGYYKLQVWGAQGGSVKTSDNNQTYGTGGKGGYATGVIALTSGDVLYVHTGGHPNDIKYTTNANIRYAGGINGGGYGRGFYYSGIATVAAGGGGATDIRINTDSLYARVIVAGGGSGSTCSDALCTTGTNGYAGGGATSLGASGYTASISAAGENAGFGYGANSTGLTTNSYGSPGGGGGFYGGGSSDTSGNTTDSTDYRTLAGGGSGYVYTSTNASSYPSGVLLTSDYYLTSASTSDGTTSFTTIDGESTETGHSGNGYAIITYCGAAAADCS